MTSIVAIAAAYEQIHLVGLGTVFVLPAQPLSSSLLLFLNGLFLTNGVDYTLNNATVTILHKSLVGTDTLTAYYLH
jgi:hypothetical protein